MKNIKGKFPLICFIACSLLIVILTTCDDGYHASIRSIWLSTEDNEIYDEYDEDKLVRHEYPPITGDVTIKTDSDTDLYIVCDIPSSIRTVSLKLTYKLGKIDIPIGGYEDDPDFEDFFSSDKETYKTIILGVDYPLIALTMKAKEPLTEEPITVTVQPGNRKFTCKVKT